MINPFKFARIQDKVLFVLLCILAIGSVLVAIFGASAAWQTPLILLALILIINLVSPVSDIRKDVQYIRETRYTSARTFERRQHFYEELAAAVKIARSSVDATHIRDNPPEDFGPESETYMEVLEKWAMQDDSHSARRVISVKNPRMLEWARHLNELSHRIPNYHVRVVDWSISAPALNMAIVDGKAVYLALTGEVVERTNGFAVADETTATYFSQYYTVLWNAGVDLNEFLAKQIAG